VRRGRVPLALIGVVIGLSFHALSAAAVPYDPNNGAAVGYTGTSVATGGRADVTLYSASVATGHGIAHPFQVASNVLGSDDFVGWGTTRGVGTSGGITDCPDDYSSSWQVYADGNQFGQYWCRQNYGSLSLTATAQQFKFFHGTCSNGLSRWVLFLNSVQKTCALIDSSSGSLSVGSESILYDPQELDVLYDNLQVKFNSGWASWGSSAILVADTWYYITKFSNTEYYLGCSQC
jgi:hypothetical protein